MVALTLPRHTVNTWSIEYRLHRCLRVRPVIARIASLRQLVPLCLGLRSWGTAQMDECAPDKDDSHFSTFR